VNSHLGYSTRFYQPPEDLDADWKVVIIAATPPESSRGGVLMMVEGGRMIVTLAGAGGDYPPTDEEGFSAFARSLPSPLLADAIDRSRPISNIAGYRRTENVRHDYAKVPRFLDGFVSIGDAVCAFNPVYGQGMTVAAEAASVLDECLRDQWRRRPDRDLTGLAKRYHRRLSKVIGDPWLLATGEDLRYPQTTGAEPTLAMRIVRPYLDRVLVTATNDPEAHRTFMEVVHLVKPPRTLFRPGVLIPVLAGLFRRRRRRSAHTARGRGSETS